MEKKFYDMKCCVAFELQVS